ncbi:pentapeptide repeat-containing protein [Saccharothrix longispora]|uniref:pentapeptide repeat-containing protein n=1 Tax=Saccharothrix longispora TaxID=33920 RepID=UPI0028FD81A3|nr:pentapeptide repeat-containing protein [Saccharothrix longispora]MDU0294737.1 pentapeptide repeat-containing protein [Saccharothrix longispora]
MPRKVIATVAALIATTTIGLVVVLWWAGTAGLSGVELVNARFNALRTGLSIGVGGGGIFALYLAWRRQHATEIGLVQKERDQADVARAYELQRETAEHTRQHAERVAVTTERDAEARRITDLYAKSVEQLGSDKAPIRHGGLYALERLAQDHPDNPALRQTVVNVLCAYLRVPFDLPGDPPDTDADRTARDEHREQVQEREVRLTAQRILTKHVNPGSDTDHPAATFWTDTDFDLTAAVLIDWEMENCLLRNATFRGARFTGHTSFMKATFTGNALFYKAISTGDVLFDNATFSGHVLFDQATFIDYTSFDKVTFTTDTSFREATFSDYTSFDKAMFTTGASFRKATFASAVSFRKAVFAGAVSLGEAKFAQDASLRGATFRNLSLDKPSYPTSWPPGWRLSSYHTPIKGREGTWHDILTAVVAPARSDAPVFKSIDDDD